jgi:hypothetical protein
VEQIKGKINDAQRQLGQLQDKLKNIRTFIKQHETQKA